MPPQKHIPALDGVRAFAILTVFIHHAWHVPLLWMGVDFFFVLSGFLITGTLLRSNHTSFASYIGAFYKRRVQRILPAYVVVLAISTLLFGGVWLAHWYMYFGAMNLAFLLGWQGPVGMPLWSLAIEEQFYLLWPLLVFFVPRRRLTPALLCLIAAAPVARVFCGWFADTPFYSYMLLPCRMDGLSLGALLALHWPSLNGYLTRSPRRAQLQAAGVAAVSVGLIVAMGHWGITTYSNSPLGNAGIYECTLAISGALFLFAASGGAKPVFQNPVCEHLARISYSMYLTHLICLELVPSKLLAFVCTVAWSTASWYLLEQPILRWKRTPAHA